MTKPLPATLLWFLVSASANGQEVLSFHRVDYAASAFGGMVTGDFNRDGAPDLTTCAGFGLQFLAGKGDGTFQPAAGISTPHTCYSVTAADFDRDGRMDVAINGQTAVSVLLGDGNGAFPRAQTTSIESALSPLVSGDFNGDGIPDLAVLLVGGLTGGTPSTVTVLLGNGNGTFAAQTAFEITSGQQATAVTAADFNNDGRLDLAAVSGGIAFGSQLGNLWIGLGRADGGFTRLAALPAVENPSHLATADVDGDGNADLIMKGRFGGNVRLLLGNGAGGFLPGLLIPILFSGVAPILLEDIDGDRKPDLVGTDALGRPILMVAVAPGFFSPPLPAVTTTHETTALLVSDLNSDGKPDLVTAAAGAPLSVLLNAGLGWPYAASAASGITSIAPDSIASIYRLNLNIPPVSASTLPLPMEIAGVSVEIRDAGGAVVKAPLLFVSPTQINFLVPPGVQSGVVPIDVVHAGTRLTIQAFVQRVAPAIFMEGASAYPAAIVRTFDGEGQLTVSRVAECGAQSCQPIPIRVPPGSHVFLGLFGTGIRHRTGGLRVVVGNSELPVLFAGPQSEYPGLDQIEVEITGNLNDVNSLYLSVDGLAVGRYPILVPFQ